MILVSGTVLTFVYMQVHNMASPENEGYYIPVHKQIISLVITNQLRAETRWSLSLGFPNLTILVPL